MRRWGASRLSKVWVVSGVVFIGTGLALAGFGAWLAGNPNCDAADLGRSCIAASLGVAVVGAALTGAGWLRVRRLAGAAGDESESRGLAAERPGIVLLVFVVVGLVLLSALLPLGRLPVDVYRGPAPAPDRLPQDLLPPELAGLTRTSLDSTADTFSAAAVADYEGGVLVAIHRFNATNATSPNATPESVAAASQAADDFLNGEFGRLDAAQGSRECVKGSSRHWFTQTGPQRSELAWRAGNFVFEVTAPTPALRDQVAAALAA